MGERAHERARARESARERETLLSFIISPLLSLPHCNILTCESKGKPEKIIDV